MFVRDGDVFYKLKSGVIIDKELEIDFYFSTK